MPLFVTQSLSNTHMLPKLLLSVIVFEVVENVAEVVEVEVVIVVEVLVVISEISVIVKS